MERELEALVQQALERSGGEAGAPAADALTIREEDYARMARAFVAGQERSPAQPHRHAE